MKQVHLIISGYVQKVGYRAWTQRLAQRLQLVGWVKNREDGAVEVVAQGAKENLVQFISSCRSGPDVSMVEDVSIEWINETSEYSSFEVVY